MSCGLRSPSGSASAPTVCHVPGMNCIGPTARSYVASPSQRPPSESVIRAVLRVPSNWMPMMPGRATPSSPRRLPPNDPWLDSTRPIAATRAHERLHPGSAASSSRSLCRYAVKARVGIPLVSNRTGAAASLPTTEPEETTSRAGATRPSGPATEAGSRTAESGTSTRAWSDALSVEAATGVGVAVGTPVDATATPHASRTATGTRAAARPRSMPRRDPLVPVESAVPVGSTASELCLATVPPAPAPGPPDRRLPCPTSGLARGHATRVRDHGQHARSAARRAHRDPSLVAR